MTNVVVPPAPPGASIRARRLADIDGLVDLHSLPGYRHGTLRLPFPSAEQVRSRLERLSPGSLSLVATVAEQIVAEGGIERFAGRRAHVAELWIGVHDDWTGKGIGSALIGACLDSADRWMGIRRVQLTVYTDNLIAIRLYERFGFVREGVHRCDALRDGRYVDSLAMARFNPLDPFPDLSAISPTSG